MLPILNLAAAMVDHPDFKFFIVLGSLSGGAVTAVTEGVNRKRGFPAADTSSPHPSAASRQDKRE